MKRSSAKKLVESLNPEGVPILGHLVWWDLEGVEIAASTFQDLFEECGLPTGLCISTRSRTALTKALKELERGKLIRKIIDDSTQIVFVVVREEVDADARDVDFEKENRIIYDKILQDLEFRIEGPVADQIRKQFEQYIDQYTSREVRTIVTNTIKRFGGITVRRTGGTYFVTNAEVVAKLHMLFEKLPGTLTSFTALGVADTQAYRGMLLEQIKAELLGDLRKVRKKNKELLEHVSSGKARPKSLETQLRKMDGLKKKAETFKSFGLDVEAFDVKIQKSSRSLRRSLQRMES